MNYLTAEQVLFLHARLIEETGGSHGVRDVALLESAVARPRATFDEVELYPDVFCKASALIDSLIRAAIPLLTVTSVPGSLRLPCSCAKMAAT